VRGTARETFAATHPDLPDEHPAPHLREWQNILVFHAFVKKTQRTPAREIRLAQKHRKELLDAQD
jgi:hypothetical protein